MKDNKDYEFDVTHDDDQNDEWWVPAFALFVGMAFMAFLVYGMYCTVNLLICLYHLNCLVW